MTAPKTTRKTTTRKTTAKTVAAAKTTKPALKVAETAEAPATKPTAPAAPPSHVRVHQFHDASVHITRTGQTRNASGTPWSPRPYHRRPARY